jgi:serine phosphatase RsbU (regulator of sigma subunit)
MSKFQPTFWSTVSKFSRFLVMAAVFSLFASFGLMALEMNTRQVLLRHIIFRIVLSGGFAILYATAAMMRRFKFFCLIIAIQMGIEIYAGRHIRLGDSVTGNEQALQHQLLVLSLGAMAGIVIAYSLLIHFFRVEGKRYFRYHTEVALASEIHASLVPPIAEKLCGFEIYGVSVPSGEVGGDLVDVVAQPDGWTGYVADVSGHGVQSGVLMAMFKTALRGHLADTASPGKLLAEVHDTIFPLKLGSMFVTVGVLRARQGGAVEFALAGHPAILHYRHGSGDIKEYGALDMPLGVLGKQGFAESSIQCAPGDLLLILTDGFTEVFDSKENELGLPAFEAKFLKLADLPLDRIFAELRKFALEFGTQQDDQTMLLARYRGN